MIGHGIGIPFGQNRNAPFFKDLAFDFNTRTDLILNNRIGDNGSFIGGYVAEIDGVDTTELNAGQDSDFNIGTDDFWMAGTFMTNNNTTTSGVQGIQGCNQASGNIDRYGIYINGSFLSFVFGTTSGANISILRSITNNTKYNYIVTFDRDGNAILYLGNVSNTADISAYSSHNLLQDNDYRLGNYGSDINTAVSALNGNLGIQIFGKGSLPTAADIEAARYGDFSTVIPKATRVWYLNNNEESTAKRSLSNTDVDFTLINDYQLQSVKDALNEGYYIDGSGNKIINPQYAATTEEVILGGKFYNGIECFSDFEPSTETIDAQEEEVTNGDFEDGTTNWVSYVSTISEETAIVHSGVKSLKIDGIGAQNSSVSLELGDIIYYDFWVYTTTSTSIFLQTTGQTINVIASEWNRIKGFGVVILTTFRIRSSVSDIWYLDDVSSKFVPLKFYPLCRPLQTAASIDSVYYDSDYTFRYFMGKFDFDISPTETITAYGELDYNVIQTYLTSSYMQKIFTKISQNYGDGNEDYIDRILAYTTQKTGDELLRVLKYINYFDNTLNYVQDEDGNYVLDIFNRPLTE